MVNTIKGLFWAKKEEVPSPPDHKDEEQKIKTVKLEDFVQIASDGFEKVKEKGNLFIDRAKECDQTQHKVIAAARGTFDATAFFLGPVGGGTGAIIGALDTETTKLVCDKVDKATQGVWKDLSFEQKLIGLGSGVGLGILVWYIYIPVLTYVVLTVANVYAAKRGADLVIQHKSGEEELARQRKLLEENAQAKADN